MGALVARLAISMDIALLDPSLDYGTQAKSYSSLSKS